MLIPRIVHKIHRRPSLREGMIFDARHGRSSAAFGNIWTGGKTVSLFLRIVFFALVVGVNASLFPAQAFGTEFDKIREAKDKVFPALVRIDVRRDDFSRGEKTKTGGQGSGVIFTPEGHVLTNYHVAGKGKQIWCILYNKEKVSARLVGDDPWTDLAVLQLDMDEIKAKNIDLKYAELGDSSRLVIGETVMAMGTPFGLTRTLTIGAVSNNERIFGDGELTLEGGVETGIFNTWIQTDAAINPGNSGGPLVNLEGKVVGINTRAMSLANNLGFTIPINVAREVVGEILKNGRIQRSDLGLKLQNLQDLEGFFQTDLNQGVLIRNVEPDSPAGRAGVMAEDVLLEFNGVLLSARFPEELPAIRKTIASTPIGSDATLTLKRGDDVLKIGMQTRELGKQQGEDVEFGDWGFTAVEITEHMALQNRFRDTEGALVTGVRPGSPAQGGGLQGGDVIRRVENEDIRNFQQLMDVYERFLNEKPESLLFEVLRSRVAVNLALLEFGGPFAPGDETGEEHDGEVIRIE